VLDLGADRYGIMTADVSGHGAPAAIVMAVIRAVLHTHPAPDDPPAVLDHINRHFQYFWESATFATAIYGVLDASRRTVRFSCAGHQAPLVARKSGEVTPLLIDSVAPLLLMDLGRVPSSESTFNAGDRLLLYTDGISEREAPDGTMFEEDRLIASLAKAATLEPGAVVDSLVADLDAFAGGREPRDDQTIVLVSFS
jgi:sigma-B regulation protein RsbU (phosphoserine phosphatase)